LKYDESGESAATEISGAISVSNIKIQAARASLTNKSTKKAEIIMNDLNKKTIFEGTYEAKKGAVTLKNFVIYPTAALDIAGEDGKLPTFYITIDNETYDANLTADTSVAAYNGHSAK
jgi:hypothetical protein